MTGAPRLVALFSTLLLFAAAAGPAIGECAGWSVSAADRHACCAGRGDLASETSVTDCCAMSEQSNDLAPTETQTARSPLKLLASGFSPVADVFLSRTTVRTSSSASHHATLIPLYLQQVSLLI